MADVSISVGSPTQISVAVAGSSGGNPVVTNGGVVTVTVTSAGDRGPKGDPGTVNLSDATPLALGTASAGSSSLASRADHTHPTLTTFPYASLSGVPSTFAPSAHAHTASQVTDFAAQAAKYGPVTSVNGQTGAVTVTASDVGLGSVNNTTDANKPVSNLQAASDAAVQAFAIQRANHTGSQAISTVTGLQTALDGKQVAGSYATLVGGQVPASMLPSFVDDVVDVGATLPSVGETGKIYVVSTGSSANKIFRWSGSVYVEISPSPGTTTDVPEGSNLYFTNARASAAAPVQSVAGLTGAVTLTKTDVGLGNVDNTADVNKPVSAAQAAADAVVQSFAIQRANHTGTQLASTISDLATQVVKYAPVTSVNGLTGNVTVSGGALLSDSTPSALGTASAGVALTASRSDHVHATPVISYSNLTDVPSTFAPSTHQHAIAEVTGLQSALDGKATASHTHTASQITDFNTAVIAAAPPTTNASLLTSGTVAPARLPVATTTTAGVVVVGNGLSLSSGILSANVTSVNGQTGAVSVTYSTLSGVPSSFTPSAHASSHATGGADEITPAAIGAASSAHTHTIANIVGLQAALNDRIVSSSAPTSPTSSGTAGLIAYDSSYLYVCHAANSWKRIPLSEWVATVPGEPSSVVASAGDARATLAWTAPSNNGGAAITNYTVQYSSNSGTTWTTFARSASAVASATVTGLTNGTSYTFRVAAVNDAGTGAYSSASSAVTPVAAATVPGVPTFLRVSVGNQQINMSWTAPSNDGGSAITNYLVEYEIASTWTTFSRPASTATSATVTGLTNGNAYRVRVSAINSVGTGPASEISNYTTPARPVITISAQPSNQTAASGAATFSVNAGVNQDETLSVQWEKSTNNGSTWTAISGATSFSLGLTGLVAGDSGSQYRVIVSATGGATSVTSSAATLTVSSGPIFTSQKQYNGVTENLGLTGLNTNQISFSGGYSGFFAFYHNASSNYNLTITTSITMQATIWSPIAFPGSGELRKEGDYALTRTYTANTPFTINGIPSGLNPFEMSSGALGANRMTWTIS